MVGFVLERQVNDSILPFYRLHFSLLSVGRASKLQIWPCSNKRVGKQWFYLKTIFISNCLIVFFTKYMMRWTNPLSSSKLHWNPRMFVAFAVFLDQAILNDLKKTPIFTFDHSFEKKTTDCKLSFGIHMYKHTLSRCHWHMKRCEEKKNVNTIPNAWI